MATIEIGNSKELNAVDFILNEARMVLPRDAHSRLKQWNSSAAAKFPDSLRSRTSTVSGGAGMVRRESR